MAITELDRDRIFLLFSLSECRQALDLFDEVDRLSAIREQVAPNVERREFLSVFQMLRLALHFFASVSRIYWPPAGDRSVVARGERLRTLAGLPVDHPLRTRALRNHVEHIDERLDDWTHDSPRPYTSVEWLLHEDASPQEREQAIASAAFIYDCRTKEATIFGDTFSIADLKMSLEDVLKHTSRALSAN
jgi:hypothetical protein